jgi:hypothetical protein
MRNRPRWPGQPRKQFLRSSGRMYISVALNSSSFVFINDFIRTTLRSPFRNQNRGSFATSRTIQKVKREYKAHFGYSSRKNLENYRNFSSWTGNQNHAVRLDAFVFTDTGRIHCAGNAGASSDELDSAPRPLFKGNTHRSPHEPPKLDVC